MSLDTATFRGVARDPWVVQGMGCLWAAAILVGIVVALDAWLLGSGQAMEPSLEVFVRWSVPVGVPVGIVLAIAAWRVTTTSRIEVVVSTSRGGNPRLRVGTKVDEEGPFVVRRGWDRVVGGRGITMLWCDVEREGVFLVRFSTEVGALVPPPSGWPHEPPPMARPAKHGGFVSTDLAALVDALSHG